ncbi:hypothetical protein [Paracoccus sp. N5]|uniref:hypothetical protein n=1 Tax=Paracoccus sp. N5 TaxID=1101189 RepID=UPI0003808DAD|nr:hypothetical protein [Paracoccus sp. N5]
MQLRHLVIALALTASPSFAELRPEHKALMSRFAALRHECVNTGLKGPACDEAEGLARQLAAAGVCFPAEENPYYCRDRQNAAQEIGRFHAVANSAAIRPRIDLLIAGQDKWVDFVITKGGVEGPGRVRTIAGQPWRLYTTCRQYACSDQAITMAVSADNSTVYLYLHGKKQRPTLLGNPPDGVRSALIDMK